MHNMISKRCAKNTKVKSVVACKLNIKGNFCRYPHQAKMSSCHVIALAIAAETGG